MKELEGREEGGKRGRDIVYATQPHGVCALEWKLSDGF